MPTSITELPPELLLKIIDFLPPSDRRLCRRVCRQFAAVAESIRSDYTLYLRHCILACAAAEPTITLRAPFVKVSLGGDLSNLPNLSDSLCVKIGERIEELVLEADFYLEYSDAPAKISGLLVHLKRLTTLRLRSGFEAFDGDYFKRNFGDAALAEAFGGIRRVVLDGVWFYRVGQFDDFIGAMSRLEAIEVICSGGGVVERDFGYALHFIRKHARLVKSLEGVICKKVAECEPPIEGLELQKIKRRMTSPKDALHSQRSIQEVKIQSRDLDVLVIALRKQLKGLGAEISEEKSTKGTEDDLHKIVGVCDVCFKEGAVDTELEVILNSIVSIMVSIPLERGENVILAFCEKLTKVPVPALERVCLKALWRLYNNLDQTSPLRYRVYCYIDQMAKGRHACHICACTYGTLASLVVHLGSMHPELPQLVCTQCNRHYKRENDLTRHMRYKHPPKTGPPVCPFCAKSLSSNANLKRHMDRRHSEIVKPFKCDRCSEFFHIESHRYMHVCRKDQQRAKCDICQKTVRTTYMREHMNKQHNPESKTFRKQQVECDLCGTKALTKAQLLAHFKKEHKLLQSARRGRKKFASTRKRTSSSKIEQELPPLFSPANSSAAEEDLSEVEQPPEVDLSSVGEVVYDEEGEIPFDHIEEIESAPQSPLPKVPTKIESLHYTYHLVIDALNEAEMELEKTNTVSSDLEQIQHQQDDFRRVMKPLSQNIVTVNLLGQDFIKSAQQHDNDELERDLERMNERWNDIKDKMNEQCRDILSKWMDVVANQKLPSVAEYREKKLLKNLQVLGKQLIGRFDGAAERRRKLFQDKFLSLSRWLEGAEKSFESMEQVPSDEETILQRIHGQVRLHGEIISKKPDFSELADIAGQVKLHSVGGEEEGVALGEEELQGIIDRYTKLGALLDTCVQKGVRHLILTCQQLYAWVESMQNKLSRYCIVPVPAEKLCEHIDGLKKLDEDIASRGPNVQSTVEAGSKMMKHISLDEMLQLKGKLESVQSHYGCLTKQAGDFLKQSQLFQQFQDAHTRLVDWMAAAESILTAGDTRQDDIHRLENDLAIRSLLKEVNFVGPKLCQLSPGHTSIIEATINSDNRRFGAIVERIVLQDNDQAKPDKPEVKKHFDDLSPELSKSEGNDESFKSADDASPPPPTPLPAPEPDAIKFTLSPTNRSLLDSLMLSSSSSSSVNRQAHQSYADRLQQKAKDRQHQGFNSPSPAYNNTYESSYIRFIVQSVAAAAIPMDSGETKTSVEEGEPGGPPLSGELREATASDLMANFPELPKDFTVINVDLQVNEAEALSSPRSSPSPSPHPQPRSPSAASNHSADEHGKAPSPVTSNSVTAEGKAEKEKSRSRSRSGSRSNSAASKRSTSGSRTPSPASKRSGIHSRSRSGDRSKSGSRRSRSGSRLSRSGSTSRSCSPPSKLSAAKQQDGFILVDIEQLLQGKASSPPGSRKSRKCSRSNSAASKRSPSGSKPLSPASKHSGSRRSRPGSAASIAARRNSVASNRSAEEKTEKEKSRSRSRSGSRSNSAASKRSTSGSRSPSPASKRPRRRCTIRSRSRSASRRYPRRAKNVAIKAVEDTSTVPRKPPSVPDAKPTYRCSCTKEFQKWRSLYEHSSYNFKGPVQCPKCERWLKTRRYQQQVHVCRPPPRRLRRKERTRRTHMPSSVVWELNDGSGTLICKLKKIKNKSTWVWL